MPGASDEQAVRERFSKIYEFGQSEVMRRIERSVCGSDYGATSWTTLDEARMVGEMLALAPGKRLLDVGSGSGWPGLFLAKEFGCDIALTDLPFTGLRIAMKRAAADRLAGDFSAAVADGAALPFIESDIPYPEMLAQAGWDIAERQDLTAEYRATMANMAAQLASHADEVSAIFGDYDAADELGRRRATLDALDEGLIRRELFSVLPSPES